MNSIMERWIGSCRRELMDRTLIWNQRHFITVLREYEDFYNKHRSPHRALGQAAPLRPLPDHVADLDHFQIQRQDRAGGVIHQYRLVAEDLGTRRQSELARHPRAGAFLPDSGRRSVGRDPGRPYPARIPRLRVPGTIVETRSIRAFPQLRVSIRACGPRTFGLIRQQMAHGGMYPFFEPEEAK
jgi:hypothetical protein